ncbi:MAG: PfkB family carbohydrate kinase, partial [Sphingobacterium sp.]
MSILTFGEILLRIQGHGDSFWDSPNHNARIYPGGSEANVAATLAKLGHRVDYLSAFPNNTLADQTCQLLERIGVDC